MNNKGVIPEYTPHLRNYDYEVICGANDINFPTEFEIPRENTGTLKNQGTTWACVAEVIAQIAESFYGEEMAEGLIYATFRDAYTKGKGLYVTHAMKFWLTLGTLPKKYFDILVEMPEMKKIADKFPDLQEKAKKYPLKSYFAIDTGNKEKRDTAIKTALMTYNYGLLAVSNKYFDTAHCILLTGWNDNTNSYKIKNSWGTGYGDNGFDEIPREEINSIYVPIFEEIELPFTDVSVNDWFYPEVKAMYFNGISKGTSDTTYEPNRPVTRAEDDVKTYRILKMLDERFDILTRVIEEKINR